MNERSRSAAQSKARSEVSSLEVRPSEHLPIKRSLILRRWLLSETTVEPGRHSGPLGRPQQERRAHWLRVMCLSGLDYFSTLGYQPAIAALAAGAVAPLATFVLVLVTLFAALPVYRRVAAESPHGAGSIAILAKRLPHWSGKLVILAVLGAAATDFMITMTLSAADATAHLVQNPFVPAPWQGQEVVITLLLLAGLGAVFLRGFNEAILIATVLVPVFLMMNLVVLVVALVHLFGQPVYLEQWWGLLTVQHGNPLFAVALALLIFPKLALGLSGFETGVSVMPQIRGDDSESSLNPVRRVRQTRKLLTTSALIMSGFLVTSSVSTVALIPAAEFQPGGGANGRALAYLAHDYLGAGFGSAYDLVTIAILWFAGASAMAGLLNLVPRYLPRFGMAPKWAGATKPLVLVFMAIAFGITVIFDADVNAQGGAYATGVLILISSAAIAVMLSARQQGKKPAAFGFGVISLIFIATTAANIVERPDGIKVVGFFVAGIVLIGFLSRAARATELRATSVQFDPAAVALIDGLSSTTVRLVAHDPSDRSAERYREKIDHARLAHKLSDDDEVVFIEVVIVDSSDFENDLKVSALKRDDFRVLTVEGSTVPNAIAAVSLYLNNTLQNPTHLYFRWNESRPTTNMLRFMILGEGAIAAMTHEVLRAAEPVIQRRPWVHVA